MKIVILAPLRQFAGVNDTVEVGAETVSAALGELPDAHSNLHKHLLTPEGKMRAFVNLDLNYEDVRYLPQKETTAVKKSDTLSIIPSIAGGCV